MKIIVAGCGKIGSSIIEQLSAENHEVSMIDTNEDAINELANKYDVIGVVGDAADYLVQKKAGIEDADLLIAATNSDETNLLSCLIAKKLGNCHTIPRVRNPIYTKEIGLLKDDMGLSLTFNPELLTATEISRMLRFPAAVDIDVFAHGKVELMQFYLKEGNILSGKTIIEARKTVNAEFLICAIERNSEIEIPGGSFELKEGDRISFVATPVEAKKFFKEIGEDTQKITNVMIIGGGRRSFYLARLLKNMGMKVKIIEKDKELCEVLSQNLPEISIIHGDASNTEILKEEGIKDCDAVVTLTGIDEQNAFLSMSAAEINPQAKIITKINRMAFGMMLDKFNVGSVIYPKQNTAENIATYVRAMQNGLGSNVETIHMLLNNKVEALEFVVPKDVGIIKTPLKNLNLKDDLMIAAILRDSEVIYPNGNTTFQENDRVIVVTTEKGIVDISNIIKA